MRGKVGGREEIYLIFKKVYKLFLCKHSPQRCNFPPASLATAVQLSIVVLLFICFSEPNSLIYFNLPCDVLCHLGSP